MQKAGIWEVCIRPVNIVALDLDCSCYKRNLGMTSRVHKYMLLEAVNSGQVIFLAAFRATPYRNSRFNKNSDQGALANLTIILSLCKGTNQFAERISSCHYSEAEGFQDKTNFSV